MVVRRGKPPTGHPNPNAPQTHTTAFSNMEMRRIGSFSSTTKDPRRPSPKTHQHIDANSVRIMVGINSRRRSTGQASKHSTHIANLTSHNTQSDSRKWSGNTNRSTHSQSNVPGSNVAGGNRQGLQSAPPPTHNNQATMTHSPQIHSNNHAHNTHSPLLGSSFSDPRHNNQKPFHGFNDHNTNHNFNRVTGPGGGIPVKRSSHSMQNRGDKGKRVTKPRKKRDDNVDSSTTDISSSSGAVYIKSSEKVVIDPDIDIQQLMQCPRCEEEVKPVVRGEPSRTTHIIAAVLVFLCLTPFMHLPYWCNCKTTPVKRCSICGAYLTEPPLRVQCSREPKEEDED